MHVFVQVQPVYVKQVVVVTKNCIMCWCKDTGKLQHILQSLLAMVSTDLYVSGPFCI